MLLALACAPTQPVATPAVDPVPIVQSGDPSLPIAEPHLDAECFGSEESAKPEGAAFPATVLVQVELWKDSSGAPHGAMLYRGESHLLVEWEVESVEARGDGALLLRARRRIDEDRLGDLEETQVRPEADRLLVERSDSLPLGPLPRVPCG